MDRRSVLRGGGTALAAVAAGCLGGGGGGSGADVDDWLSEARGYDGTVDDRTGEPEVRILVGANQGLSFGPAGVRVSTGTRIVWEWTGKGKEHNVVSTTGAFESQFAAGAGHTFTQTFDSSGARLYYCEPHRSVGMKGAIDVV